MRTVEFSDRVQTPYKAFERDGPSKNNVNCFQVRDTKVTECILSAAKPVARKKTWIPALANTHTSRNKPAFLEGSIVRQVSRRVHLGKVQLQQAGKCHIDLSKVHDMTTRQIQKQTREARKELWDTQKSEEHTQEKRRMAGDQLTGHSQCGRRK